PRPHPPSPTRRSSELAEPGENTLKNVKEYAGEAKTLKKLKLAVTPSGKTPKVGGVPGKDFDLWDDMGKLLKDPSIGFDYDPITRSEEHTSELQSRVDL